MEKTLKLNRDDWLTRQRAGLPMEGVELVVEKTDPAQIALREIRERFLAGVTSKDELLETIGQPLIKGYGAFIGSLEWRSAQILLAARENPAFNDADKHDVEVIATFEDKAYLYDYRAKKYYIVKYDLTDSGGFVITDVREMTAELVVKEQQDYVRKLFRSSLVESTQGRVPGILKMASDLADFAEMESAQA